jgi:hypothetical protein
MGTPRRLVYGWKPLYKDLPNERPSRVTFGRGLDPSWSEAEQKRAAEAGA